MKCDKCGATTNPGDQICINCGAKLSIENMIMPEVEKVNNIPNKKEISKETLYIVIAVLGVISLVCIVILITVLLVR